jgi:hypothetical protein
MEQLISDIETWCARNNMPPQRLLRKVLNAKWGQWQDWKDRKASPTVETADRLRAWMAENDANHSQRIGAASPEVQGDAA